MWANCVGDPSLAARNTASLSEHVEAGTPWRAATCAIMRAYPRTHSCSTSHPPSTSVVASSTARCMFHTWPFVSQS